MEPQKKPIHLNENDTPYLYEPFRNQMPAKRPHPAEKEKILKPWQGLLVFAFLMVLFNLAGIPLVLAGGMYGNALDEIIVFLIGSILVVRALHIPLKEVFPLKKPDGAGILGTILMWYVTYAVCLPFPSDGMDFPAGIRKPLGIHGQQYGGPFLFRRAACRCADTGHL